MDEQFWSTTDTSVQSIFNSTSTLPITPLSSARQPVSAQTVAAVGLVIVSIGTIANSVVLAVLIRARRQADSNVHALIANQSAADLYACAFHIITIVMMLTHVTHGRKFNANQIADSAICLIFEREALLYVGK